MSRTAPEAGWVGGLGSVPLFTVTGCWLVSLPSEGKAGYETNWV